MSFDATMMMLQWQRQRHGHNRGSPLLVTVMEAMTAHRFQIGDCS
jgi:hypothetical protein